VFKQLTERESVLELHVCLQTIILSSKLQRDQLITLNTISSS